MVACGTYFVTQVACIWRAQCNSDLNDIAPACHLAVLVLAGTGIQLNVAGYQGRSTAYPESQPGLGSLLRAAVAYDAYALSA